MSILVCLYVSCLKKTLKNLMKAPWEIENTGTKTNCKPLDLMPILIERKTCIFRLKTYSKMFWSLEKHFQPPLEVFFLQGRNPTYLVVEVLNRRGTGHLPGRAKWRGIGLVKSCKESWPARV